MLYQNTSPVAEHQEGVNAASTENENFARLDNGGISEQFQSEELPLWWNDCEVRKGLRGHHARLSRLLQSMETGGYGLVATAVANKWLQAVKRCPGSTRRHKICGRASFYPYSCGFPLCPWCQHRRSDKARRNLSLAVGLLREPKLITLSPPNVVDLTPGAVAALIKVFTRLRHRKVFKGVRGGVRSIETTLGAGGTWNLHCHSLLDSPWIAHYPQTDIKRVKRHWVVVNNHPGLAREFTKVCQAFPEFRSPRPDFNIDDPNDWYFVDIRRADKYGAVAEVVKYIAKGAELVQGGPSAVVDFLMAIKGRRMIQGFGSLYNVDLDPEPDEGVDASARGECPYVECPSPSVPEWEFVNFGPGNWKLDRDGRTGSYRIVGVLSET